MGDDGRARAVGSVGSHNLGCVGDVVGCRSTGHEGSDSSDGELHFCWFDLVRSDWDVSG